MIQGILLRAVAVSLLVAAWCPGAEQGAEEDKRATINLGGGVVALSKPYEGIGTRLYPAPLFTYEGERLYLRGITGGYRLFTGKGWWVGPVVQPRLDGYDESDSHALAGMHERKWSMDGGANLSWVTGIGLLELSCVTDLLGRHNGQEVRLSDMLLFKWMGFDFIPSAGVKWKSDRLINYYYGVKSSEARAGRPAYEGAGAIDPFVQLAVRRGLSQRWSLLTAVQYEWLDDGITDSPIVDAHFDVSFLVGVLYSW